MFLPQYLPSRKRDRAKRLHFRVISALMEAWTLFYLLVFLDIREAEPRAGLPSPALILILVPEMHHRILILST